jgi:hypothetical protein
MSKTIFGLFGGAVSLTENAGIFTLSFDESLGGGAAKGIVVGSGSVQFNGPQGLQLGWKLLNAHLPASLAPLAPVVEGVINTAVAALE